jgi:hypothetical protein
MYRGKEGTMVSGHRRAPSSANGINSTTGGIHGQTRPTDGGSAATGAAAVNPATGSSGASAIDEQFD